MKFEIEARKREAQGTGASRRLRNAGKVPGIVYGGEKGPVNLELDHKDLFHNLANEKFHASILTLKVDGSTESVLLRAFNMHPWKAQVQHVDFQRVSKDRKIHMKVPLHFVNAELSAGVKEQGGMVSHVLNELNITCFPDDLPEFIEVDLSQMTIGRSVHLKDITMPKGVEPVLHRGDNPVVASIVVPKIVTEEEEAAAAEATPSAADVPALAQAAPDKAAEGEAAKAGDKEKDKGEKKEKK
jgi:large subunit ribosomal protein L25